MNPAPPIGERPKVGAVPETPFTPEILKQLQMEPGANPVVRAVMSQLRERNRQGVTYGSPAEFAEAVAPAAVRQPARETVREVATPGQKRCEDVAAFLNVPLQHRGDALQTLARHTDFFRLGGWQLSRHQAQGGGKAAPPGGPRPDY